MLLKQNVKKQNSEYWIRKGYIMKLDIVKHKFIYLAISAILLIPGIIAMVYSMITYPTHTPVKVGIDYTGGTTLQYGVKEEITNNKLANIRTNLEKSGIETPSLQIINVNSKDNLDLKAILSIRTKFIDEKSQDLDKINKVVNTEFKASQWGLQTPFSQTRAVFSPSL